METEGVDLRFTDDAIDELTKLATDVNASVENIGARRLHTVLEKIIGGYQLHSFRSSRRSHYANS